MTIITAENLGKKYIIGHQRQGRYLALRDVLVHTARGVWQRIRHPLSPNRETTDLEEIWALKDVNFEIQQGERVGIIGRNGAGKSTLLKILSRITHPTTGRVHIKGRVASLLEVGTGFHPELTGRENIYLNGAVLGMTRQEIKTKFDEIVAFAEVEKFLDTPVKRYSSGMYVRLAFAVAAHLEPEILLVDEVLAVGDAGFQKKCLGKMNDISTKEGRTVLFVSHNMPSIESLCTRGLILNQGKAIFDGDINEAVSRYLNESLNLSYTPISSRNDREGNGEALITDIDLIAPHGIVPGKPFSIVIYYRRTSHNVNVVDAGIGIWALNGTRLISLRATYCQVEFPTMPPNGSVICHIPELALMPGTYFINPSLYTSMGLSDYVINAVQFDVENVDFYGTGKVPNNGWGVIVIKHQWKIGNCGDHINQKL